MLEVANFKLLREQTPLLRTRTELVEVGDECDRVLDVVCFMLIILPKAQILIHKNKVQFCKS